MNMKRLFKYFFRSFQDFWTAALVGVSTALFVFLAFLQRHFFSYRYLAYTLAIAVFATFITGWMTQKFLKPRIALFPKSTKSFCFFIVTLLSVILLINIKVEPLYYILPDTTLEVSFSIAPLSENEEGVRLLWIESGQGYVPYTYLTYEGEWERIFGNTIFPPDQQVTLRWTGKVGKKAEIAFRKTSFNQPMTVSWNGETRSGNLQGSTSEDFFFRRQFDISWYFYLPFVISFFITSFYLLLFSMIWIASWRIPVTRKKLSSCFAWLRFATPMLLVWTFVLLILWPGILTNDSLTIWSMAKTGQIDDWQSAFYTFVLSLLIKILPSPAFVLFLQILSFSLVVAWGLFTLEKIGVPGLILWVASVVMAVFPPTILYVVTLWKDIPYSVVMLAFTIALLAVADSSGKWVEKPLRWVALGIIAFLISILRHNGGPVALITLLVLPVAFKKHWKAFTGSIAVAVLLYLFVRGPFYNHVIIADQRTGQSNLIYLHHIAAHLHAGTELTGEEKSYLDQYLPLEEWDYNCCYVGNISYDTDFKRNDFLSNTPKNRALAMTLFKRAPFIDIQHAFCAGEMSYQFMNDQQCWHMKSLHGFISTQPGNEDWIGERDHLDISESSFFPQLIEPLILFLRPFGIFDANLVFFLRPAFWLFVSVYTVSVLAIRNKGLGFLLPVLPTLGQSMLLFLIAFATAFRYYYSNCLIGIFLLTAVFMPAKNLDSD